MYHYKRLLAPVFALLLLYLSMGGVVAQADNIIELPTPLIQGDKSLEQLLQQRRSVREYEKEATMSLAELGQLLWAAQGITHPRGLRTAPSAGALYPLEIYVVAGNVNGIAPGVYHYQIPQHRLQQQIEGDKRIGLGRASHWQTWMAKAAVIIVFAAEYERTARKYGVRAKRYVHMEVGHAGQNLFLQAEALGLATVVVGAFNDEAVSDVLKLPDEIVPLTLMPVGRQTD